MTRYRDTVLFNRWLDDSGNLTFGEWLADRRLRAEQRRQQNAYAKRMAPIWAQMQGQQMNSGFQQQAMAAQMQGRPGHTYPVGGALGNLLGGLLR